MLFSLGSRLNDRKLVNGLTAMMSLASHSVYENITLVPYTTHTKVFISTNLRHFR